MGDFDGKVVIVTGAGSGLGREASKIFAQRGASLCLVGRTAAKLDATAEMLRPYNAPCTTVAVTLGDHASCAQVIQAAIDAYGKIDVLCNIAAEVGFQKLDEIAPAAWDRLLASNLSAPFFLMQLALPHLLKTAGNIVNVASTGGVMGQAYLAPYTATKFGLIGLTKSLAMEFMKSPVRINALAPGAMATAMSQDLPFPEGLDRQLFHRYTGMRPQAQPQDVAEILVFLASDKARAIHGACYMADNGISTG